MVSGIINFVVSTCKSLVTDAADDKTKRFQVLVALMLSSQTKDGKTNWLASWQGTSLSSLPYTFIEITFAACQKLRTIGFSPQSLAKVDVLELEKLLYPVGFFKTKARNIKTTSRLLLNEHDGDIPNTVELLMKLPGVGPKVCGKQLTAESLHNLFSFVDGSHLYEGCLEHRQRNRHRHSLPQNYKSITVGVKADKRSWENTSRAWKLVAAFPLGWGEPAPGRVRPDDLFG